MYEVKYIKCFLGPPTPDKGSRREHHVFVTMLEMTSTFPL